jgi:hypothetical protein
MLRLWLIASSARQERHLVSQHRAGQHSTAELSDVFGVGRSMSESTSGCVRASA